MTALITADLVDLDLKAADRAGATAHLAGLLAKAGRVTDARSRFVTAPTLGFGRSTAGIDFGAEDGPAHLIFLIAAPEGGGSDHMTILASLARRLVHRSFRESLLGASAAQAVVDLVDREVLGR